MEFSYGISEAEYLSAARLKFKGVFRLGRVGKIIMFWVIVFASLMCAFRIVQIYRQQPLPTEQEVAETAPAAPLASSLIENVVPVIFIFGTMAFVIFIGVPMQLRRQYRKNPAMQGEFAVKITPDSISTENTAGISSKTGWNIYDSWREGKGLILLVFHSGAYFLISLAALSEVQQNELRGILSSALPKK